MSQQRSDSIDELHSAMAAYAQAFPDNPVPQPFAISDAFHAEVLREAVASGSPVSPNFNWWSHLPPGAVA